MAACHEGASQPTGSSNPLSSRTLWLCSEPTGWPFPHIIRSHGCWLRLPTWVCTAAGLWDFTVINSSRGSSPPSELEKMEGKEWEQKSAEKSEKEKRTTLRWEEEREWPAGGISASWGSLMGSCISDRSPTFSHSTALSFSSPWRIIKTDDTDAVPSGTTALDCRAICTIIYRPPPNSPPSPCPPL